MYEAFILYKYIQYIQYVLYNNITLKSNLYNVIMNIN